MRGVLVIDIKRKSSAEAGIRIYFPALHTAAREIATKVVVPAQAGTQSDHPCEAHNAAVRVSPLPRDFVAEKQQIECRFYCPSARQVVDKLLFTDYIQNPKDVQGAAPG